VRDAMSAYGYSVDRTMLAKECCRLEPFFDASDERRPPCRSYQNFLHAQ
jgi:hypothetical protein